LKICFVIPSLSGGGAERQLKYLSSYLISQGVILTVIYRTTGPEGSCAMIKGVEYVQLKAKSNYSIFALFELFNLIRIRKPDVVQTWIIQSDVLVGLIKFILSFKWVVREANIGSNHKGFIKKSLREFLIKKAHMVVANSPLGFQHWSSLREAKLILNGVFSDKSTQDVELTKLDNHFGTKNILYVGRLTPHKNVHLLISSFDKANFDDSFKLIICGDGPQLIELKAQAKQLGLAKSIIFLGFLPKEQIDYLMQRVDLLCLVSDYEGMPNVVVEAMRHKTPVLLSPSPSHEAIFNSNQAYFASSFSIAAISNSLIEIFNQSQQTDIIENAYVLANDFTIEVMGSKYHELYKNTIRNVNV